MRPAGLAILQRDPGPVQQHQRETHPPPRDARDAMHDGLDSGWRRSQEEDVQTLRGTRGAVGRESKNGPDPDQHRCVLLEQKPKRDPDREECGHNGNGREPTEFLPALHCG
jgi:hypothetical protein